MTVWATPCRGPRPSRRAIGAQLAERIGDVFRAERFDALVLLAPPRALGWLRKALEPAVRERLVLDAPRDLISEAEPDLRRRLRDPRFHTA